MKVCYTCQKEKNFNEFGTLKRSSDGLHSDCKVCRQNYERNRRHLKHLQGLCVNSSCQGIVDGSMFCNACKAHRKQTALLKKAKGVCKQCNEKVHIEGNMNCIYHIVYGTLSQAMKRKPHKNEVTEMLNKFNNNPFCCYTGMPINIGENAELDHKNPLSTHPQDKENLDNLQWVSKIANRSKSYMTHAEYLNFCLQVVKYNKLC